MADTATAAAPASAPAPAATPSAPASSPAPSTTMREGQSPGGPHTSAPAGATPAPATTPPAGESALGEGLPEGQEPAEGQQAPEGQTPPPEAAAAQPDPEVEVGGEKFKLSQVGAAYQAKAAQFEDLSTRVRSHVEDLKKDPVRVVLDVLTSALNGDEEAAKKAAMQAFGAFIDSEWEYSQLPQHEKDRRKLEREISKRDRELAGLRQERAQRELETKNRAELAEASKAAVGAGLPGNDEIVRAVRDVLRYHRATGKPQYTPAEAATEVKAELTRQAEERLKALDGQGILGLFPQAAELIRKADIDSVRAKLSERAPPLQASSPARPASPQPQAPRIFRDAEDLLSQR